MRKKPEELAALYRRAAEEVHTRGLSRGIFEQDGKVCTIGALSIAATGYSFGDTVYDNEILAPVARQLGWSWGGDPLTSPFQAVADWNDAPDRTAEQVADLLECAALGVLATVTEVES